VALSRKRINAKKLFYDALKDKIDPEAKRKMIGKLFIDVFHDEAEKIEGIKFLGQGTIYPDVIESGTKVGLAD
jgi:GMP synthase (glutamine-hydrolysing)